MAPRYMVWHFKMLDRTIFARLVLQLWFFITTMAKLKCGDLRISVEVRMEARQEAHQVNHHLDVGFGVNFPIKWGELSSPGIENLHCLSASLDLIAARGEM